MRVLVLIFALLMSTPLAAQNDNSNPIIARMEAFVAAYNAQDVQGILSFYTPDAVLFPPGQKAIIGHQAIGEFYAQAFAAGARELQFKTFDIRARTDIAVEIGETVVQAGDTRVVGRYMHVWEVMDGQIMLTRDMYHILQAK